MIVFLTLLFGIVEFGRAIWLYQAVSAASREGARYGIGNETASGTPQYLDCPGMRDAARERTPDLGLADSDIAIAYVHPDATTGDCTTPGTVVNASSIQVTVSRAMDVNLPLVPLTVTISSTDERSIYNGVDPSP